MEHFKELGLSANTIRALQKKGFEEPTEIQKITIPLLLKNNVDIIAQAQTGTGKTAAFGLPLLEMLDSSVKGVQAIILAPTRELVIQVCEELNSLRGDSELSIAPIYGGQSMELQLKRLKKGVSIVVGTPGRVMDHMKRKTLSLKKIQFFILDEADEMLNMGFIDDIETVLKETPEEKRVLLFSATMPAPIKKLAEKYMREYTHVKSETKLTTKLTDQIYFEVLNKDKFEALCRIIDIEVLFYGLIFCRTKIEVDTLVSSLHDRGYAVEGLHGDMSQVLRERTLTKFRKQNISILVATDVAARGIDVENITHVINYAIPQNPEAYIHRIGRTGRAGKHGVAITFITPSEFRRLGFIKQVAKTDIRRESIPNISDVIEAKMNRISEEIGRILFEGDIDSYKNWAGKLLENGSPQDLLASVLKYSFGKSLDKGRYKDLTPPHEKKRGRTIVEEEGQTRLFIAKGKKDNITKKDLVEFLTKTADIPKELIDKVEILDSFSFVTVPFAEAEIILRTFNRNGGKRSVVTKAKEQKAPSSPRNPRTSRPHGSHGSHNPHRSPRPQKSGSAPSYGGKKLRGVKKK